MNRDRKIAFLRKQNDALKKQVKDLQNETTILSKENQSLRDINSSVKENMISLEAELVRINEEKAVCLIELNELRQKYNDAVVSVIKLKKQYKQEMERLLNRIRKHK